MSSPASTDAAFPRRVLILFAHPALEKSRVNRRLADAVRELPGVTFHDLYESYPDFMIHVEREQRLVEDHDVVIWQHPFFWYSTPALIKEWEDLVLQHGWAYGTGGTALHGKFLLSVISTGGREAAYCSAGSNRFTMRQLLTPIEQTARLCGMRFLPPFVVHGTLGVTDEDLDRHAAEYRRVLEALRDDRLPLEGMESMSRLNQDVDALLAGNGVLESCDA